MPFSTPNTHPDVIAQQHFYVRDICLYDYRALGMPSFGHSSANNPRASQYLVKLQELTAAQDEDALRVQKALSLLSGTTTGHMCEEGALASLDPIITRKFNDTQEWCTVDDMPSGTDGAISAQAHSIAAYAYYRKYMADERHLRQINADATLGFDRSAYQKDPLDHFDNILKAACHATHAAAGAFVSPAVLMAGFALRGLAAQVGVDMGLMPFYRPLWRATERWARAVNVVKRGREAGGPARGYSACSAHGCTLLGVPGYSPWGTRTLSCYCGLKKVWYCSPECQDQDWMRHQASCTGSGFIPPPTAVQHQYDLAYNVLSGMYSLERPLTRTEAIDEGDIQGDPLDGVAMGTVAVPCPFGTPGKELVYMMRHYPCQRR